MTTLELQINQITEIKNNTFKPLRNLNNLSLSSNELNEINATTFNGLNELKQLLMYGNKIKNIHQDSLNFMTALETVHLGGNEIEILPKGLLSKNLMLKKVVLYDNRIKSIDIHFFKFLTKLEDVSLTDNHCIDKNFNIAFQDAYIDFQISMVPCYSNSQRIQIEMLEHLPSTLEVQFNLLNTYWWNLDQYSTELYGDTQQKLNTMIQDINELSNKAKSISDDSQKMLEKSKFITEASIQDTVEKVSQKKTDLANKFMIVLVLQIIIFIFFLMLMTLLVFGLFQIRKRIIS